MSTYIKNNAGVFLKSATKLFKQNYNVGKGFKGTTTIYISTKLRGLSLNQNNFNVEILLNKNSFYANGGLFKIATSLNRISFQYWNTSGASYGLYNGAGFKKVITETNCIKKWLTFAFNDNFYANKNIIYSNGIDAVSSSLDDGSTLLSGTIAALEINNIGESYVTSGNRSAAIFYEFRLFNRVFNITEILYNSNNGTYNEPFSLLGIEVWYKFDLAEILDFSDALDNSDLRVGVRDFSGNNRHGELINLPAGTLQEKLDYANANLIVTY
jgi:hypothetical protein